jgi:hypothetical protein
MREAAADARSRGSRGASHGAADVENDIHILTHYHGNVTWGQVILR